MKLTGLRWDVLQYKTNAQPVSCKNRLYFEKTDIILNNYFERERERTIKLFLTFILKILVKILVNIELKIQ